MPMIPTIQHKQPYDSPYHATVLALMFSRLLSMGTTAFMAMHIVCVCVHARMTETDL